MSNLLSSNNQAKDRRAAQSEPVVSDTSFLAPPQEEKSEKVFPTAGHRSWLIPPQEEKIDVAALRGEQARLDRAINRMEEEINRRRIEHDALTVDELARDKQQRDAVLSGAAGVTGEDFGYAENYHIVRS